MGGARNVRRIRRRAGRRRGNGPGPGERAAVHDRGQRRHGEGRRIFPHDREEGSARADHRHGKSHSHALPGGFVRRVSAAAGGCVSRYRRLRAHLPQQRGDELAGNSADHGDHGHVRGRRRLSAGDDGYGADDRGIGVVSGRAVAGAGGHWAEDRTRRNWAGRQMHAAISGTVDFKEPNDHMCLARLRSLVAKMGERQGTRCRGLSPHASSTRCAMRRSLPPRMCMDC